MSASDSDPRFSAMPANLPSQRVRPRSTRAQVPGTASHITKSIASSNCNSPRPTSRLIGATGKILSCSPQSLHVPLIESRHRYYATDNIAGLSHQSGSDMTVRGQFLANGYLTNTADTNYRGIDNDSPVFGFAVDLGTLSTTTISTLFQISLHQEKCIQFERALNSTEQLPCLWTNYYSTDTDAVRTKSSF